MAGSPFAPHVSIMGGQIQMLELRTQMDAAAARAQMMQGQAAAQNAANSLTNLGYARGLERYGVGLANARRHDIYYNQRGDTPPPASRRCPYCTGRNFDTTDRCSGCGAPKA
jgi:hypothetical protein